jgi:hypothetical protein
MRATCRAHPNLPDMITVTMLYEDWSRAVFQAVANVSLRSSGSRAGTHCTGGVGRPRETGCCVALSCDLPSSFHHHHHWLPAPPYNSPTSTLKTKAIRHTGLYGVRSPHNIVTFTERYTCAVSWKFKVSPDSINFTYVIGGTKQYGSSPWLCGNFSDLSVRRLV